MPTDTTRARAEAARAEAEADFLPWVNTAQRETWILGYMVGQRAGAEPLRDKIEMMEVGVAAGDDVTHIMWCEECGRYGDCREGCPTDIRDDATKPLIEALRRLEWIGDDWIGSELKHFCPDCRRGKEWGHMDNCGLAAALHARGPDNAD